MLHIIMLEYLCRSQLLCMNASARTMLNSAILNYATVLSNPRAALIFSLSQDDNIVAISENIM